MKSILETIVKCLQNEIDRHKQILPLAEKIVAMKINMAELLALDDAVNETAEQYNLPIYTAAFRVINDIKDYNKLGGLKKQLDDTMRASIYCQRSLLTSKSSYGCFGQIKKLWNHRRSYTELE